MSRAALFLQDHASALPCEPPTRVARRRKDARKRNSHEVGGLEGFSTCLGLACIITLISCWHIARRWRGLEAERAACRAFSGLEAVCSVRGGGQPRAFCIAFSLSCIENTSDLLLHCRAGGTTEQLSLQNHCFDGPGEDSRRMSACKRAHQDGIVHFLFAHLRPGPLCALCEDIALLEHARAPNRSKGALAFVCAVSEVAKDGAESKRLEPMRAEDSNAAGILGCVVGLVGSKLIERRLPPQRLPAHAVAWRLIS